MSDRSRREFVFGGVATLVGMWWGSDSDASEAKSVRGEALGETLLATPTCTDGTVPPTSRAVEGPFYKTETPRRRNLRVPGVRGQPLRLVGRVLDTQCRPLPGVVLDFWQADGEGRYDRQGTQLRGHQLAGANGTYWLDTVRPGAYRTGFFERTPHLHLKARAPNGRLLTTQLFFPDASEQNARDPLYRDELLVELVPAAGTVIEARFDLVL